MKFVPEGVINNISTLVQIMAWRRSDLNELNGLDGLHGGHII